MEVPGLGSEDAIAHVLRFLCLGNVLKVWRLSLGFRKMLWVGPWGVWFLGNSVVMIQFDATCRRVISGVVSLWGADTVSLRLTFCLLLFLSFY